VPTGDVAQQCVTCLAMEGEGTSLLDNTNYCSLS